MSSSSLRALALCEDEVGAAFELSVGAGPAGEPARWGQAPYPSKKNRAWLRQHGIKATIPERADQITNRRKRPGRPIDFGPEQKERYRDRNVVERCFSFLKQWRGRPPTMTRPPAHTRRGSASPQPSSGYSNTP